MPWEEKVPSLETALTTPGDEFRLLANSWKELLGFAGEVFTAGDPTYNQEIDQQLIGLLNEKVSTAVEVCLENYEGMKAEAGEDQWLSYEKNLRESGIFDELRILAVILLADDSEKGKKGATGTGSKSVKNLLKKPFGWWTPKWVQDLVDAIFEVINEILDLIRGGGE